MTSTGQSHALISVDDLATHLADPEWVIVDCRFKLMKPGAGREAYHAGHIPGAFYADLDQDLASAVSAASGGRHPLPEVGALSHLFARWGVGADSTVVVYDDLGGAVSARLWWLFRWMGHSRVALLDGDLRAWKAAGQPLSTDVPEYVKVSAASVVVGRPGNMPVVTATQLEAGLNDASVVLLDARTPERFFGEQEPLDRAAGHIPGAINAPFQGNLGADGLFQPVDELRARYESMLGSDTPEQLVCMCGSGVTACHTLLALEIAGITGASLYVGSWSDWVSSPERPIATV